MQTPKKQPKISLALDLGSAFAAIVAYVAGRFHFFESPIDGPTIQTVTHHNPKSDKWHHGRDAIMHSYEDNGDNLFMHAKRNFFERPTEKIYGGRFSPADILTQLLIHLRALILSVRVELKEYPQFGGTLRPESELAIIFATPANWGVEQHANYEKVIHDAGFLSFDGFVPEPRAALQYAVHSNNLAPKQGCKALNCDVGAGTTDIFLAEYNRGKWDQLSAASGNAYLAGHDFTAAICEPMAKTFRIPTKGAITDGGLNLSGVAAKHRTAVMGCFQSADGIKRRLSVLEDVTAVVELPGGRKTFSITRAEAEKLWEPLVLKFKQCVSDALGAAKLKASDIDLPLLAGGSSAMPILQRAMAEVMERPVSDIVVCTESDYIVAAGAAEHAFFQDDASQALESGLGFRVFDRKTNGFRNLLMLSPGTVIPADGLYIERQGFAINNTNGQQLLVCNPLACRTGVRAVVSPQRETFLHDTEILPLTKVSTALDGFPTGEHEVSLGIKADPNRNLRLLVRPLSLPNVEPLSIPLSMAGDEDNSERKTFSGFLVALVLDLSISMLGEKLEMLKKGASRFVRTALQRGAPVAIVVFGGQKTDTETAKIICGFSTDEQQLLDAISSLTAAGGTAMHLGIDHTDDLFQQYQGDAQCVAVMFTDGMPSSNAATVAAADKLKSRAILICVGIGEDVVAPFLISLATSRDDYFYAKGAEGIFDAFAGVSELLWDGSSEDSDGPDVDPNSDDAPDNQDQEDE